AIVEARDRAAKLELGNGTVAGGDALGAELRRRRQHGHDPEAERDRVLDEARRGTLIEKHRVEARLTQGLECGSRVADRTEEDLLAISEKLVARPAQLHVR